MLPLDEEQKNSDKEKSIKLKIQKKKKKKAKKKFNKRSKVIYNKLNHLSNKYAQQLIKEIYENSKDDNQMRFIQNRLMKVKSESK